MKKYILLIICLAFSFSLKAQVDRSMPKSGPAPKINLKNAKKFTLKNGLTVLVVENNKLPRATVSFATDVPPIKEGDKAGVMDLTNAVMGSGTTSMSKDDFNKRIDFLGARASVSATGGFANSLSKYFDEVLALFADAIINPVFTQEELDKERAKKLDEIKLENKDVSATASRIENVLAYGKEHAYGEFVTEETVNNVTLEDVKEFYLKYTVPNHSYLIFVGDVKFDHIKKKVTKLFNGWKASKQRLKNTSPDPVNVATTEIDFVDMSNAVQSEVALVNTVDLQMNDSDYLPSQIANKILGGGGEARLFLNLREDHGFTYGSYSRIGNSKYASKFRAWASVRNQVTDSSIVELMNEVKRIRNTNVTDEELKNAKAAYIGDFVMNVEKPETVARFALNKEIQNLPDDYYTNYLERIDAISKKDIKDAANKYFSADNSRIIVVGKASDVLESLKKLPYDIKYYTKYGAPTQEPKQEKVGADVTVTSILDNYLTAIGGKEKVKAVQSVLTIANAEVQGMKMQMKTMQMRSNLFKMEMSVQGNIMQKQVYDGNSGFSEGQGQKIPMQEEQAAKFSEITQPIEEYGMYTTGILKGIEDVDGTKAYVIQVGETERNYYAVDSGLKIRKVTVAKGPNGQTVEQPVDFSDYKEVNGIKFPHLMKAKMGPMNMEFKTETIKVNEGISKEDFN